MAGQLPIPDLTRIGQTAIEIPQDVLGTEMRHISEKMSVLNTEMSKLGLPALAAGLPPLPGLPSASQFGQPPGGAAPPSKESGTRGTTVRKTTSYLKG